MKPDIKTLEPVVGRKDKDYGEASPDEIRADIERTRAHMDETLVRLGRKVRPRFLKDKRVVLGALGVLVSGVAGLVLLKLKSPRNAKRHPPSLKIRKASLLEDLLVLKTLISSARKGKPGVYVVQPRKL